MSSSIKNFVLDTNVLISDPGAFFAFEENNLLIPLVVIEELDKLKSRPGEVGQNARVVSRTLNKYRSQNPGMLSSGEGIKIDESRNLGSLFIVRSVDRKISEDLNSDLVDNKILCTCLACQEKFSNIILVSNDFNLLIKAEALSINCEEYKHIRVSDSNKLYSGVMNAQMSEEKIQSLYDSFKTDRQQTSTINRNDIRCLDNEHQIFSNYSNQYIILSSEQSNSLSTKSFVGRIFDVSPQTLTIQKISPAASLPVFGLTALNKEQKFAFDALLDDSIKLVTLSGPSGCGKTCLAIAAGLSQTINNSQLYERLIVTKPVEPIGKDLGYLPGTLEEKMAPWIQPIYDNISFLVSKRSSNKMLEAKKYDATKKKFKNDYDVTPRTTDPYISLLQENGRLEIEAITYIRGRSIPKSFIIVDEAQNLSVHAIKTLITRVGNDTKIVLTGDIEQIDNAHVDAFTNGLSHAIEKFKYEKIAAHITLTKGERSQLATLASKIL